MGGGGRIASFTFRFEGAWEPPGKGGEGTLGCCADPCQGVCGCPACRTIITASHFTERANPTATGFAQGARLLSAIVLAERARVVARASPGEAHEMNTKSFSFASVGQAAGHQNDVRASRHADTSALFTISRTWRAAAF